MAKSIEKAKSLIQANNVDIQVGAIGTAAGILGGSVGGPIGALAAELGASLATRKVNQDVRSTKQAFDRVKRTNRYKNANRFEKIRMLATEAREEANQARRDSKKELIEETVGFTIGNIAARTVPIPIPLKDAAVAIATVPSVMRKIDPYIK